LTQAVVDPRIGAKLNGEANTQQTDWCPATRVVFRFVFCYLALYCLYVSSFVEQIVKFAFTLRFTDTSYDLFWHRVVPWVGSHLLHLAKPITIFSNGSGDTTYDNVLILCELFLAGVATVIWSALDRNRSEYRRLYEWLRFVVRLVLSSAMLIYGMDKLIPVQFGAMTLTRLSTRVGDLTPFRLLWTFMAASKPYTICCGAAEVLAGILLIFPRFTTLGALIAMADMANVFALNMSYDVPVKLGALHYLLMSLFLLAPEARRLANVLVLNRAAAPREIRPLSSHLWVNRAAQILMTAVAVLLLSVLTHESFKRYAAENSPNAGTQPALYGVWSVDEFAVSPHATSPLFTAFLISDLRISPGDERWTELIIDNDPLAGIRLNNGVIDSVRLKLDAGKSTVSIDDPADASWKCDFVYQRTGDQLALQGQINGNAVAMKLHRANWKGNLVTRGFHWINERPF
jgi:uncharacterized membrane protein YphA (DoxX/SURF4 family)